MQYERYDAVHKVHAAIHMSVNFIAHAAIDLQTVRCLWFFKSTKDIQNHVYRRVSLNHFTCGE